MKHKMMLLALAAISAVMFALPTVASAAEWEISTPEKITATGGEATLTVQPLVAGESVEEVTCVKNEATGKYTTKTTGEELTIVFKECKSTSGAVCTSSGQASGTIKTTDLTYHNVMLETTANGGKIGILITPKEGHFATFTCGGIFEINVNGNGIIGEVEKKCGETSKTAGLTFTSASTGSQTWKQVETAGTVFDLSAKETVFGFPGKTRTASEDAKGTITFTNSQTITCP